MSPEDRAAELVMDWMMRLGLQGSISNEIEDAVADLIRERESEAIERASSGFAIRFFQTDWIPGFAAFRDDGSIDPKAEAFCVLNIGALAASVAQGDLPHAELPYVVADSMMHEIIHACEAWAGVEFSEDKVEALIQKYRQRAQI